MITLNTFTAGDTNPCHAEASICLRHGSVTTRIRVGSGSGSDKRNERVLKELQWTLNSNARSACFKFDGCPRTNFQDWPIASKWQSRYANCSHPTMKWKPFVKRRVWANWKCCISLTRKRHATVLVICPCTKGSFFREKLSGVHLMINMCLR